MTKQAVAATLLLLVWCAGGQRLFKNRGRGLGGGIGVVLCPNKAAWSGTPPIPDSFDARTAWPNCISPVRDQLECGSCWAFATTQTLTDRFCIASNSTIKRLLSPQDLVECDQECQVQVGPYKNNCDQGCSGGYVDTPWDYFQQYGVVGDSCLTYTGEDGSCTSKCNDGQPFSSQTLFKSTGCYKLPDVPSMQAEIMQYGSITAGLNAYEDFLDYTGGVYIYDGTSPLAGGHALRLIGWGTDADTGTPYWLGINQWTTGWGEDGLLRIRRGTDEVGIESYAVAGQPVTLGVAPQVEAYPPPAPPDVIIIGDAPTSRPAVLLAAALLVATSLCLQIMFV